MTDFRALCAELLADYDNCHYRSELADRARALLAQPEPVAPTDEALLASVRHFYGDQAAADMGAEDDLRTARAVLARWGTPASNPVPVSERLPRPEDSDAEGQCWWWHPDHKEDEFSDGRMLLEPRWADGRHDSDDSLIYTHWLPHHALPMPQQEVQ